LLIINSKRSLSATNRVHNESLLREKFEFLIAFHENLFSENLFKKCVTS